MHAARLRARGTSDFGTCMTSTNQLGYQVVLSAILLINRYSIDLVQGIKPSTYQLCETQFIPSFNPTAVHRTAADLHPAYATTDTHMSDRPDGRAQV